MLVRRHQDRRGQAGRRHQDWLASLGDAPHLLIVEPHDDTRLLYTLLLEEAGYAVSGVADGHAAIAIVQKSPPDVVVMEMTVAGADGFEILRRLRETPLTADVPAIVVTASLHFDLPPRARASGAVLVLAKPTTVDALLSALAEVMVVIPRARFVRRRLTRAFFMIRTFAKQCALDPDAQQHVRAFIDRLQVAILAVDEHGQYVAVSRGASRLTGYSRTELLRMSVFDTTLGTDLPLAQPWQDAQVHGDSMADTAIRDASGKTVNIHMTFDSILSNLHAAALVVG